ncbi:unnamed protein product [Effrenium voratum]|nr:unnamed protein product [Effrenium voratum]
MRAPSTQVTRLAKELLKLNPAELQQLRQECRERLIPKPAGSTQKLPKDYNPRPPVLRADCPLPVRQHLASVGRRLGHSHPVHIFAGGPTTLPSQVPPLSLAIMAPHWAQMAPSAADLAAAASAAAAAPPQAAPAAEAAAPEAAPEDEEAAPAKKEPKKDMVALRLLGFEASKKIAVVKEVRAMLGAGLKESKEKVESAPVTLKKGVPIADAEALAEKLRALGAEVALE